MANGMPGPMPKPVKLTKEPGQTEEEFAFDQKMQDVFKSDEYKKASESDKRQLIGDCIYDYVENVVGSEKAPKITGMILSVPYAELIQILQQLKTLFMKINEADNVLTLDA